jgi:hypothetical protein
MNDEQYVLCYNNMKNADVTNIVKFVTRIYPTEAGKKTTSLWEIHYLLYSVSRKLCYSLLGIAQCYKTVNFLQSNGERYTVLMVLRTVNRIRLRVPMYWHVHLILRVFVQ